MKTSLLSYTTIYLLVNIVKSQWWQDCGAGLQCIAMMWEVCSNDNTSCVNCDLCNPCGPNMMCDDVGQNPQCNPNTSQCVPCNQYDPSWDGGQGDFCSGQGLQCNQVSGRCEWTNGTQVCRDHAGCYRVPRAKACHPSSQCIDCNTDATVCTDFGEQCVASGYCVEDCSGTGCDPLSTTPLCNGGSCQSCLNDQSVCTTYGLFCHADGSCKETDPCSSCTANQTCTNATCVDPDPCNGLCTANQTCTNATCVDPDPCNGLCTANQTCTNATCVDLDPCNGSCTANQTCQAGQCVDNSSDPCNGTCNSNQVCQGGQCVNQGNSTPPINNCLLCDTQTQKCVNNLCVTFEEDPCDNCVDGEVCIDGQCQEKLTSLCSPDCDISSSTPYCQINVVPAKCSPCFADNSNKVCTSSGKVCNKQTGHCDNPLIEITDGTSNAFRAQTSILQILALILFVIVY